MAQSWKKQASVAYGYSLTRLTLNMYLFFEELSSDGDDRERCMDADFMKLAVGLPDGNISTEQVDALRKRIYQEMEAVIAYTDCFRIYEYALNRVERRFVEGRSVPEVSEDEFVASTVEFVTAAKDGAEMNWRIQEIIGQLPVRFTRQKYYGMVHDALTALVGSSRKNLESTMYLLRTSGMVELTGEKRKLCPELGELLDRLSRLSFKELSADDYREAQNQIGLAGERLFARSEYFRLMEDMVNDLYVICLTREDAVRDASEEVNACGIIRDLCALYEQENSRISEELDALEERLYSLEGIQESYYEKYQRMDPAPEYREGEDETAYRRRCVDRLLSASEFASLDEEMLEPEDAFVGQKDVDEAFDGFVSLVDPVLASSQRPVARAIMALTLSNLPVCFNSLDEIRDYIKNSLGSCTDRAEKETCMELLQQLMESEDHALV